MTTDILEEPEDGVDGASTGEAVADDPFAAWRAVGIDPNDLDPEQVRRALDWTHSMFDEASREEAHRQYLQFLGVDPSSVHPDVTNEAVAPKLPSANERVAADADDDSWLQDDLRSEGLTKDEVARLMDERLAARDAERAQQEAIKELKNNVESQLTSLKTSEGLTDDEHQFVTARVVERLNATIQSMSQEEINTIAQRTWDDLVKFSAGRTVAMIDDQGKKPKTTTPKGPQPTPEGGGFGIQGALERTAKRQGWDMPS